MPMGALVLSRLANRTLDHTTWRNPPGGIENPINSMSDGRLNERVAIHRGELQLTWGNGDKTLRSRITHQKYLTN